jgi:cytochrome c6
MMNLVMAVLVVAGMTLAPAKHAAAQEASDLYKTKCQACHGTDGKGETAAGKKLGAKDFHSPEVSKMSDAELIAVTKTGKEKMPAYDKKLTDDQIKQLITYIRTLK